MLLLGLLSVAFQAGVAAGAPGVAPAGTATLAAAAALSADPGSSAATAPAGSAKAAGGIRPAPAMPANTLATNPVQVSVVTSLGSFTIELLPERAPLTVAQFLSYVDQGFYSGTVFHRVIPSFVIQGGGFDTSYKLKVAAAKVPNESGNGLTNQRGTVGLARPADPHAGDSQFYVNLFDNVALDPNQTRWGYAVFGRVVQGMDIVDRIGNVATGSKGPFKEDAPQQQIVIEHIDRVTAP